MPTIYEEGGLVFFFYSSDMDEPAHVHIEYKEGGAMKAWLSDLEVAWVKAGMPKHKQTQTLKIIEGKQKDFLDKWYEFKNQRNSKSGSK